MGMKYSSACFGALLLAVGCQTETQGDDQPSCIGAALAPCDSASAAASTAPAPVGSGPAQAPGVATAFPPTQPGPAPSGVPDDGGPTPPSSNQDQGTAEPPVSGGLPDDSEVEPPTPGPTTPTGSADPGEGMPPVPSTGASTPPESTSDGDVPTQPSNMPSDAGEPNSPEPEPEGDDLCNVGVWDGSTPEVLNLSGATFAHDPTMVEADGVFYRFWTGDNVPMATSTDLRNWSDGSPVYQGGYPDWVRDWRADNPGNTFNFPWAPDASYFGGRFHIYSSFSAFFGRNVSCITHLSTDDPASGNWTDEGPVICTDGNQPYNAIDADVALDENGTPWLSFGSFWDGIMAFQLDLDGNRVGDDLTHLAWAREIEAPVIFRRCGYYYLFVTWGLCCPGEGRSVNDLSYRVAVGRSENIMGPYVDRDGVSLVDGGGTLLVQGDGVEFAAAGHSDVIVRGDTVYHFYHAYRQSNGAATLRIVELPFDDEGWPVPGGP